MATIRVTCPACNATTEVDADRAGTQVECPDCFQVFKAKGTGGKIKGEPSPRGTSPTGRPPAARRRDEDDDYDHDHEREDDEDEDEPPEPRRRRPTGPVGLPSSVGTFVLGGVAIFFSCVPFVSIPLAIVTLRRPPAAHYPAGASGLVRVGKLLAQISLGLWVLAVILVWYTFRKP